jgi:hypothetical protein
MTIHSGLKFSHPDLDYDEIQIGEDPGDGESPSQAIALGYRMVTRADKSRYPAFDLVIYRGSPGDDLTFYGMTRTELVRLGKELIELADQPRGQRS